MSRDHEVVVTRFRDCNLIEEFMNANQSEDSLKKRYAYKLGTNLVNLALSLVTAGIAPRALGASAYGNFEYLTTAFFQKVINIFDAGTSACFYTKLSQRMHDTGLVRFYWGFAWTMSGLILLFVAAALAGGWNGTLWPEIPTVYVWLGLGWGLLTWYNQIIGKIVDATGQTVGGEMCRMLQRVLGTGLLLAMFWITGFGLPGFFFIITPS